MMNRDFRIGISLMLTASLVTVCLIALAVQRGKDAPATPIVAVAEQPTLFLVKAPRTKEVSRELLNRSNVDPETLRAALIRWSTLSNESACEAFYHLLESLDENSPKALLKNLATVALFIAEDHEDELRSRLTNLTNLEHHRVTRQAAYAAQIAINGSAREMFSTTNRESLSELIESLPLVDRFSVEDNLYTCIRAFIVDDESNDELHTASISAALDMPHAHSEFVADLVELARKPNCRPSVTAALAALPADALPEADLGHTAAQLIARIADLQSSGRSSSEIRLLTRQCIAIGARLSSQKRKRIENRLQQLFQTE